MIFPETRNKIDQIASTLVHLNESYEEEINQLPQDQSYIITSDAIRLIKGKRVEMIIQKRGEGNLKLIYKRE